MSTSVLADMILAEPSLTDEPDIRGWSTSSITPVGGSTAGVQ